jgi:hypothetical protein
MEVIMQIRFKATLFLDIDSTMTKEELEEALNDIARTVYGNISDVEIISQEDE